MRFRAEVGLAVDARILIVARDDVRAGPLAEGLDRLGWRTITARGPYAALAALGDLPIEAVIVDLASAGPETQTLARRLKAAVAPRACRSSPSATRTAIIAIRRST
jgi:two-component system, cell cycle response regulator PopA